jgi:hypothetical protein
MIEQWKRLWFVLDETKLFYVADPQEDGSYHSQVSIFVLSLSLTLTLCLCLLLPPSHLVVDCV